MTEPSFEDRFASLEDSNRLLAENVRALTATLVVVGKLEEQQREQAARQKLTEKVVTERARLADDRDRRTRKVVRMVSATLAILLPAVSILVYWSLIVHVNQLLDAQRRASYSNCQIRNAATTENASREQQLAQLEDNPKVSRIHTVSAQRLRESLINCDQYKRRPQ